MLQVVAVFIVVSTVNSAGMEHTSILALIKCTVQVDLSLHLVLILWLEHASQHLPIPHLFPFPFPVAFDASFLGLSPLWLSC